MNCIEERNDLAIKIANLKETIEDTNFHSLYGECESEQMENQLKKMEEYLSILSERMFSNNTITDVETKLDFNIASAKAAYEYEAKHPENRQNLANIFLDGVHWMAKYMNNNCRIDKSRRQIVHDKLAGMYNYITFVNEDGNEFKVEYVYNDKTDSFETKYGSVSLGNCKKKDITFNLIDKLLYNLEVLIIDYFYKEKKMTIFTPDD